MRLRGSLLTLFALLIATPAAGQVTETRVTVLVFGASGPGRRVPLAGARVSCHTEDVRPVATASRLVATTKTDAFGVATLTVPEDRDYHWLIDADGYGVAHEYGGAALFTEGDVVVLQPGTDRRFRLVAPFGGPLVGARVELYMGCSHSPAARVGVSDGEGVVQLADVHDSGWDLWITAQGVDPGPYSLPFPTGTGMPEVITDPGLTAIGTIVDGKGDPQAGGVVRELGGFRGPVTVTDEAGAFTLHGLSGRARIGVFREGSPFAPRPDAVVSEFTEGVPLRIVLSNEHPTALGEGEPRHRLDVVIEEGDSFVPVRIVRVSDGLTMTAQSGFYTTTFDVPPGTWQVTAGGGFSFEAVRTALTEAPVPDRGPVRMAMTEQQGAFGVRPESIGPSRGEGELRIPGAMKEIRVDATITWIPIDGPAALLVREPYPRLVSVPPAEKDTRFLHLPEVGVNRIRFRVTDHAGKSLEPEVEGKFSESVREEDGSYVVECRSAGLVDLSVAVEGYLPRDLKPVLPPPPAVLDLGTIVLRPESDLVEREFAFVAADGEPVEGVEIEGPDGFLRGDVVLEIAEDAAAAAIAPGYLPLAVVLSPKGPAEFRFPAGRVVVERAERAWLDGWEFEAEDGPIVIEGVLDGTHALTTLRLGEPPWSREVTVADGGTVTIR